MQAFENAIENVARCNNEQMKDMIEQLDKKIAKDEQLAYHYTSKDSAAQIMTTHPFGLRASKKGQKGGGLFVCKASPDEMGWDKYGGPKWRKDVGEALWGENSHEVQPGGSQANKLDAVIIVKIRDKVFNDIERVLMRC